MDLRSFWKAKEPLANSIDIQGLGLRLGDFRARGKVCTCVGVWTRTGICSLVGMVCVRVNPGAGRGVEDGWALG